MERTIIFSDEALKQFLALAETVQDAIEAKLDILAIQGPAALGNQLKRLRNSPYSRLRVGDYRVVYSDSGVIVAIAAVGKRDTIYKRI